MNRKIIPFLLVLLLTGCHASPSPTFAPPQTPSPAAVTDHSPLVTVSGVALPEDEVFYVLAKTVDDTLAKNPAFRWEHAEEIRASALETMVLAHILPEKATALGLGLTDDTKAEIDTYLSYEEQDFGGRDAFDVYLESLGASLPAYRLYNYEIPMLEEKLSADLFAVGGPYAPTEDDLAQTYKNAFFNAQYIRISKTDPNMIPLQGEDLEAQRSLADMLWQNAADGEDFTALVKAYCQQDAWMEQTPEGFPVERGSGRGTAFDAALTAVAEGEISPVCETDDGFYIIHRLPDDPTWAQKNRDRIAEQYAVEKYAALIAEWESSADVVASDRFAALDVKKYAPKG